MDRITRLATKATDSTQRCLAEGGGDTDRPGAEPSRAEQWTGNSTGLLLEWKVEHGKGHDSPD